MKNLTMLGFKSFADKTSLDFQDGVTAIVGPNGCGKSNVADAIRWVLGEQSAKALRGGAMHDVIFSGTDKRKAMQMAEVSLTLDDVTENQLQAAGLELGYSEVTITRRVYRDGGSEYFINKTQCRLKDIQQLFMGTGIGRTSYSIMAQGNITQILSSKPDDRRIIFEEAAGITRYKAQKKEALRKLEHTEQNLLRVEDLIGEVKRRIGTLQRQAGKAKKYKEIMDALKDLDTRLSRHKLDVLIKEQDILNDEASDHKDIMASKEIDYKEKEKEVERMRMQLSEIESRVSDFRQKHTSLNAELDQNSERILFHEQRIQELDEQKQQATHESIEADERLKAARSERERASVGLVETEKDLVNQREVLQEKNEKVVEVERKLGGVQEKINELQSNAYIAAQELASFKNRLNQFDLAKQGDKARLEKLHSEKGVIQNEIQKNQDFLSQENAAHEEKIQIFNELESELHKLTEELTAHRSQLADLNSRLDSLNTSLTEYTSRLAVLEQLENDSATGKSAHEELGKEFSHAIKGRLIDHIKVADKYVQAVEAVIQDRVNMLILNDPGSLEKIANYISNNEFASVELGLLQLDGKVSNSVANENSLDNFVDCDNWIKPLVKSLLADYVLTENISDVLPSEGKGYVTLTGIVIHPNGIAWFPSGKGSSDSKVASALHRKNEISKLQSDIESVLVKIESSMEDKGNTESKLREFEAKHTELIDSRRKLEIEKAGTEAHIRSHQSLLSNLKDKLGVNQFEIEKLEESQDSESKERNELEQKIGDLDHSSDTIRNQMESENQLLESIREERNQATSELTDIKVTVASKEEILKGFQNQLQPLDQRISDLESLMDQREKDQLSFSERRQQSVETIENAKKSIAELETKVGECQSEIVQVESEKSDFLENIKTEQQSLKDSREYISKIQAELTRFEVELAEKKMHVESIVERVQERYSIDLHEVPSECITITLADSGLPEVHTLSPQEMEEAGASVDWDAVQEHVDELQSKVDSIGPVNLVAIEEYEETEQRFEFLNTQHRDLTQSKEKLLEAVNRINTETREMFVETFSKIRNNFQETFEEIFGGGKADLILVDEEDVLESGIDIVARPPGKKLQSISLLSGGEQTMTAVSLLFAIYQVKPSPFCVLDELDAPLDESNINRFLKVLRRFVSDSQFLIITHSKRTISMADILYGVTMQERGVSKIISVRFKQLGDSPESQENVLDEALKGAVA